MYYYLHFFKTHTHSLSHRFTIANPLTIIHDVFFKVKSFVPIGQAVDGLIADWPEHTLLPQVPHEELQADERKHAEAEHRQDHHIRQLLH